MSKWYVTTKKANFTQLGKKYKISDLMARIIRNRDLIEEKEINSFLFGKLDDLYNPMLLADMEKAVTIIKGKIKEKKKIRVIGDYDIDGVCATYILKKGIEICGGIVDAYIPHRIYDGYGLNDQMIQKAFEDQIDVIITCDNGIAAKEQIDLANKLGITVIITDHHEVPFEMNQSHEKRYLVPNAEAIIDPKQENCFYPYASICGAMITFKFIQQLTKELNIENELTGFMEFAAIATIGDVMPLLDENRIIVKYGLLSIAQTKNIGLKALIEVNDLSNKKLSPYHIGFVIGPCLNASGRLDSAMSALELFDTKDEVQALKKATELKALNDNRKDLTAKGVENAILQIENSELKQDKVLVVYLKDCHESLAGIIAGRIREKYGKPTFILTTGEHEIKGSGRSIDAYHMYDEMNKVKELFLKFGGHKLAAGLSLKKENISILRRKLNENTNLTDDDFLEKIKIDIPLPLKYATLSFVEELTLLEPHGMCNPKPLFAQKNISFISGKILGKNKNVLKLVIEDDEQIRYDAIFFGDIEKFNQYIERTFGILEKEAFYKGNENGIVLGICYYPDVNEYGGCKNLQIIIKDYCFFKS